MPSRGVRLLHASWRGLRDGLRVPAGPRFYVGDSSAGGDAGRECLGYYFGNDRRMRGTVSLVWARVTR